VSWILDDELIILDTETTGQIRDRARIVELAVARIDPDGKIIETFQERVNPEIPIPSTATLIHGIKDKDVVNCPTIKEVLPRFFDYSSGLILTAYNLPYDQTIVRCEMDRCGVWPPGKPTWRFCSFVLAKRLVPVGEVENYKLATLGKHYNIDTSGAHGALEDVMITLNLLQLLFSLFKRKYPNWAFKSWMERPFLLNEWPVGKHRGKLIKDTPSDYLRWAQKKMTGDELHSINFWLERQYES